VADQTNLAKIRNMMSIIKGFTNYSLEEIREMDIKKGLKIMKQIQNGMENDKEIVFVEEIDDG
jgi:hypothetical protein